MKTVGFVGLGIMGTPMALNLIAAGYSLVVWNRDAKKCEPLIKAGAEVAGSPREVATSCEVVFAMVSDPEAALAVALGPDGVVAGLRPGRGYVDISTVDGATAIEIDKAVSATGAKYLEAPVSGSKKPAEDGTLIFLAAGDRELYDLALPALEVMGKMSLFLGETGNGAKMKLVVNMVMGSMMAAFSEGLCLADNAGLDAATLLNVLDNGAIANPMFRLKGPALIKGKYPTAFPLKHMQKDMRLALALGDQCGQPLPVAASANQDFVQARKMGLGDEDFGAVHEVVKGRK
jgi:glyoxylate/succinic semialdehyde reductase